MSETQQPQSLRAVLGVRELIFSGSMRPGERLSEVALAKQLEVSRTPLRAALARLEQEGLLEPIPSGGFAVRGFSQDDVIDAIELRGVLEGTAVRLAAERGVQPAKIQIAQRLVAALDEVTGNSPEETLFEKYVDLNAEFHALLADLSGSPIVQKEIERVTRLPFASPSAFLDAQSQLTSFRASLQVGQAHHRAIVEAIELREGSRAESLAREHARLARQNLALAIEHQDLAKRVPALALVAI